MLERTSYVNTLLASLSIFVIAGCERAESTSSGDLASTAIVESCPCPDSPSGATGTRTVIDGVATACGCPRPSNVQEDPPDPPPVRSCPQEPSCPEYTEEATSVSARSCCTQEGTCGSSSSFVFGTACVERGGEPGVSNGQCPDEGVAFLDMKGCCLPEGVCGLSVAQIPNFADIGCLDRARMKQLVNDGSQNRDQLATVFLLNDYVLARWDDAPIACDPSVTAPTE